MASRQLLSECLLLSFITLGLATGGCQVIPDKGLSGPASEVVVNGFNFPPRLRYGATPCACMGARFIGEDLGTHGYYFRFSEKNGIAYTRRGGHIDTMHLRIATDWTAYLAAKSYRNLTRGERSFSYKLLADRSRHTVHISYPEDWQSLSQAQRDEIAREVALAMGPYLAYTMVSWHEIITWYGFRSAGVLRESHSAFSWEDSYSNLLGAVIATRALRDTEHSYDEAVSIVLDDEMRKLGIQPADVARQASESVKGEWYAGLIGPLMSMKKRNPDIGIDDGFVTPVLPLDLPAGVAPVSYPAPTLDDLSEHGFWAFVEIEPHEWERGKVLRVVYPNGRGKRIYPTAHFPAIIDDIRQEAIARYGPDMVNNAAASTARHDDPEANSTRAEVSRRHGR